MSDTDRAEGLLKRIEALLTRAPAGDGDDDEPAGRAVPYDRFFRVNQRAKAAEDALRTLRDEVAGIKAAHEQAFQEHRSATAAEVAKVAERYSENLTLQQAGFDDVGREALRAHRRRMPEAEQKRPASEWWAEQVEATQAHRADPTKAAAPTLPPALAVYLPAAPVQEPTDAPLAPETRAQVVGPVRLSPDRGVVQGKATGTAAIEQAQSIGELLKAVSSL